MTCLSCNDKHYLHVKQAKTGETLNKGCHTGSYVYGPKIKDLNWFMKCTLFFQYYLHKHNDMLFLRLKGLSGAQRRKGCTKKRKSLYQNGYKRMNHFKTITKTIISKKILPVWLGGVLFGFLKNYFPGMFWIYTKLQT